MAQYLPNGPALRDDYGQPLPEAPGLQTDTSLADQQFGPEGHAARVEWFLKNAANTALPVSGLQTAYDRMKNIFTGSPRQYNDPKPGPADVMIGAGIKAPEHGILPGGEHIPGITSQGKLLPITGPQRFADWFKDSPVTFAGYPEAFVHHTHSTPNHLRNYISAVQRRAGNMPEDFQTFLRGHFDVGAHFGTPRAANDRMASSSMFEVPRTSLTGPDYIPVPDEIAPRSGNGISAMLPSPGKEWVLEPGSRQFPVYLNPQKPLTMSDAGHWGPMRLWDEARRQGIIGNAEYNKQTNLLNQSMSHEILTPDDFQKYLNSTQTVSGVRASQDRWLDLMRNEGIDAIRYKNDIENPGSTSFSIFNPENIKSVFNPGIWGPDADFMKSVLPPAVVGGAALRSIYGDTFNEQPQQMKQATPER